MSAALAQSSAHSATFDPARGPDRDRSADLARVAVITPCFDRPADARALLSDLAACAAAEPQVSLRVLLVDNASRRPLSELPPQDGLQVEHLRLDVNTGGSGGYNAGLQRVLSISPGAASVESLAAGGATPWAEFHPEYVWLVDSDARVLPSTLRGLVRAIRSDPALVAVGPAIADPSTGQVFEVGGIVNRAHGRFEPAVSGRVGLNAEAPIACDYLAACCALVRSDAARAAGLWPDRFLNGDDVEWFVRLRQITGGIVACVPGCTAFHPRFDRFPTWTRYYAARNAFGPIDALGLGRSARLLRAMREVARAGQQAMLGRQDLAMLHVRGLRDAARGQTVGPAESHTLQVRPSYPLAELDARVRERQGPGHEPSGSQIARVPLVHARGRPTSWLKRGLHAQVADDRFVLADGRPLRQTIAAGLTALSATGLAVRVAMAPRSQPSPLNPDLAAGCMDPLALLKQASLEIIVLSYNRWEALARTLMTLLEDPLVRSGRSDGRVTITVVDNASSDGTPARIADRFPDVTLMALSDNRGVEGFNLAATRSTADTLLILDDDARPQPGALTVALQRLLAHDRRAGVTLHPRHPATGASEWSFARASSAQPSDHWPVMGCANLVRRSAWMQAGGYDSAFFLYRNDADLAMRLLAQGWRVHFDPGLIVWHDTSAAPGTRKSPPWHHLGVRNWLWMCRRYGTGSDGILSGLLATLHAFRSGGLSRSRLGATVRGVVDGLLMPVPSINIDGRHPVSHGTARPMARYLRLRLRGRTD